MLDERALQEIWYGGRAPGFGLRLLAAMFGVLSALRRRLYGWKMLPHTRLTVPVIVVGNITVGGTGKTPLVITLVAALRERGWKPGVISRGYGGASRGVARVNGASDPAAVGDEAKLIFESVDAPVTVSRDRVAAGRSLIDAANVDVIIADDGLQHYRLDRDVEICVIDGQRRFGNGLLLPAGPLREKESRLASVDFRICNGAGVEPGEITMQLRGENAVALNDRTQTKPLRDFIGKRVHAIAGIGNPPRFFSMLRGAGLDVVEHPFADHHRFVPDDLRFGDHAPIMMTEKDAVKCRAFASAGQWIVPIDAALPTAFIDAIDTRLRRANANR